MTDERRFDDLLREDAAALPPPAAGEINPWSMAMTRVLWGLGLITITLNFLYLDVILPAVGGLLLVFADEHALAQCKTVCLDDHRVLALGADVVHNLCGIIESLVLCGGDAVFLHQVLGEHLGSLDAGSGLVRAESRDAGLCQLVHHAQGQRVILGHHDVVKLFLNGKAHHGLHIGGLDVLALGVVADAAVAGGTPDLAAVGALFQCLDDGVLAAAAAHYQDFFSHIIHLPVFE